MITLRQIKSALANIEAISGDTDQKYLDDAIDALNTASEALNTIAVRGRKDVDALLGCMIGIDMIIGKEE